MPDDDDAMTFDTRPGSRRLPRRGRPTDDSRRALPVRGNAAARDDDSTQAMPQRPAQGRPARPNPQPGPDATARIPVAGAGDRGARGGRPGDRGPDATTRLPAGGAGPVRRTGAGAAGVPPQRPAGTPGGPSGPDGTAPPRPRRRRRWIKWVVIPLVILAVWVGSLLWAANSAWNKVAKVDAMPTDNRPAGGQGTNVLLVGSDSRAGLSTQQIHDYGAGGEGTSRTDSIMILHMGSGSPVLLSIPRDSYVQIPGHRKNKINAAFSIGGPKLLIQTIEQATGLKMDNYMEIGFGGFAGVVDAVGGVKMCLPEAVNDKYAHIDLPAGCQTLNGQQSLGYVRSRHAFAEGDLARVKHQREFLAALMSKVASPSNLLVPWKLKGVGESGAQGLAVDKDMSPFTALKTAWTLKNVTKSGQSVQIPVANAAYPTAVGEAVLWDDAKAKVLFDALRNDQSVNVQP